MLIAFFHFKIRNRDGEKIEAIINKELIMRIIEKVFFLCIIHFTQMSKRERERETIAMATSIILNIFRCRICSIKKPSE